jgi:hypothetical protein
MAPACNDTVKNGGESDVDCGGTSSCVRCGTNKTCTLAADCLSGVCTGGLCQAPTCTDLVKNGTETDVDCGGSCTTKCANTKSCSINADCVSGVCSGGVCQAASCTDTVKNGGESDVDCGGSTSCARCVGGKTCTAGTDCVSKICTGGLCTNANCTDGVKNGSESDIDCGGGDCTGCATGKICTQGSDCASKVCTGGLCQAPTCTDGQKNGTETDIDCGGTTCSKCAATKACLVAADCVSGVCTGGVCQAAACNDLVKNGTETDVDCGGTTCAKCIVGKICSTNSDCQSNNCVSGVCQSAGGTWARLETKRGDTDPNNGEIKPHLRLWNDGTTSKSYQTLKFRYWYTVDRALSQSSACDAATPGCGNVIRSIVALNPVRDKADFYLEVSFKNNSGSIAAGGSLEVQVRANTSSWSPMSEANDHSYNTSDAYVTWNNVTVYENDALVWGTEPGPAPPAQGLKVQYKANNTNDPTNGPQPYLKIINPDPTTIPLTEITARYWFTGDGAATITGEKGYSYNDLGYSGYVNISDFVTKTAVDVLRTGADKYFQVGFTSSAGSLRWNDVITLEWAFQGDNWATQFTQSNDYSYDATKTAYADWSKVTLYRNGTLIWGTEPAQPPPRDPENPANAVNGMEYAYYEGTWSWLPNFSTLVYKLAGVTTGFNISHRRNNDNFGFVFTGYVDVPTEGEYTFYTTSDDGSKLYIGSNLIVNNDGLHAMQERSGTIGLKPGKHAIRVEQFDGTGGEGLEVRYAGPGITKQVIPASALYRLPQGSPTDASKYHFESGAQGWVDAGWSGTFATVAASTDRAFAGTASLRCDINGAATNYAADVRPPTAPVGTNIYVRVWFPAGAPIPYIQPFTMHSDSWTWLGAWTETSKLTPGTWTTFTLTLPANPGTVQSIGVEFTTNASWTGSVYVDSVQY